MSGNGTTEALSVQDLRAWYEESQVLHGVTFGVHQGEVVTLVGRNGAGKTTILRSIIGLMRKLSGQIIFEGEAILGRRPDFIAGLGVGYCPEERGIFSSLSTEENLMLPPQRTPASYSLTDLYTLFPNLAERASAGGTSLSGGEQQMLAIARIMRAGARMLLLDEPSEGLAPVIVTQIGKTIGRLKEQGHTVLLVEQNMKFAQSISDRFYVVELGNIVDHCTRAEISSEPDYLKKYLTV
jgi:branched-chain amino acid transport system ATP-binding protein